MIKTILIAGGQGYIGSYLYTQLKEQATVTSIDYGNAPAEKDFISLDHTDTIKVNEFADKCPQFSVLIFLVGLAHTKGRGKDLPEFKDVNYQTLVNLLSSLDKQNKIPQKIIFASTISVYCERYNQSIYLENLMSHPFSPYALTKLQAEDTVSNTYMKGLFEIVHFIINENTIKNRINMN